MPISRQCLYLLVGLCSLSWPWIAHAETVRPFYTLAESMPLPGSTRWDYLTFDAPGHRLFITRGDSVDVLNVDSKKIVGTLSNLEGVHGVALAADFGKGFVTEGKANRVTVFDLSTLKRLATVPTGKKPDAVIYEAETGHIFVADGESNDLTVINAKMNNVIATIKLDGAPEFTVTDGKGRLYVNLEDKSWIDVVDTKTLKVISHYDLTPACNGPTGLALDKADAVLFSVCANKHMMVVDALSGKIKDTVDIGAHPDAAIYEAAMGLALSSNGGDGSLTIVRKADDGHYKAVQTLMTKVSARTMALNPDTHEIYLSAGETDGFDAPTAQHPEPRAHIKPNSFMVLRMAPTGKRDGKQ